MTGPEHYTEADRLLAEATATYAGPYADIPREDVALLLTFAQVHATLAQTAAFADGWELTDPGASGAWSEAVS